MLTGLCTASSRRREGVKTDRYTMEISITRDYRLKRVLLFDDWNDPYQMHCIPYEENPALFADLCGKLREKLEEADDIWFRENIMERISPAPERGKK